MSEPPALVVRAVRSRQGGHDIFSFFMKGSRILDFAAISRVATDEDRGVSGFQRPRIREQVRAIAEYVSRGDVLFPNAIVLALGSRARYVASRGPVPQGSDDASESGTLTIPLSINGASAAWIVDGQQRALALAESSAHDLMIPVVAFVSETIATQREQFILVNRAKPLSSRLIDELLPEVDFDLPRDLAVRKTPSYLCSALNMHPASPFRGLIRRPSSSADGGVVTDSALVRAIKNSISDPRGALAAYVAPDGATDVAQALRVLIAYWSAVAKVFPGAWGLPPEQSRLMHSAGIEAMGVLMDRIMARLRSPQDVEGAQKALGEIAPACRWTAGRWEALDKDWNDIQSTRRDVRLLANYLVALDRRANA